MQERLVSLFFPDGAPVGVDPSDPQQCVDAALSAADATRPADEPMPDGLRRVVAQDTTTGGG
jgi:hypothetical protein